jgi:hypothetical protein
MKHPEITQRQADMAQRLTAMRVPVPAILADCHMSESYYRYLKAAGFDRQRMLENRRKEAAARRARTKGEPAPAPASAPVQFREFYPLFERVEALETHQDQLVGMVSQLIELVRNK